MVPCAPLTIKSSSPSRFKSATAAMGPFISKSSGTHGPNFASPFVPSLRIVYIL